MNYYVPTTGTIRDLYASHDPEYREQREVVFDRWLAEHDAQVREEALAPIRAARGSHPVCKRAPEDSAFECGWKLTVLDIDKALETP